MMYGRLYPVIVCLAAAPALAQDISWSVEDTERCLASAKDPMFETMCIGASADTCMETPGGGTTAGSGYCLEQELLYWDDRLNAAYRDLMDRARASDAENTASGASGPGIAPALQRMQQAWIVFRDAACDFESALWSGGTGAGPALHACLMNRTGQQALALEQGAWLGD
ncbi:lysozyme inhibitor LprI family protein [Pukyongiella litopenaei]|uniref:DUF1311 domain-containing protein n=1 Tax=Pukyongiella litopenaei TaxID=2605946 RepID=A0A2S0MNA3_9RHOB|nr:lysozyme inhibitor LprI family protein [Pukyongiella litopenaei]AVO37221.1 DUF1311 domain-containing protein [Pukyongiella litopenaei]